MRPRGYRTSAVDLKYLYSAQNLNMYGPQHYESCSTDRQDSERYDLKALRKYLEFDCPKFYDFTKIGQDNWNETYEQTIERLHRKPLEQRKKSKSSKSTSNPRTQQRSKKRKNCENEDPNCLPPTSAKLKYFSKKNKSKEAPRHKASTSKTVEVFLFENKEQKKDKTKKNGRQISPATKTLETMVRKYRYKKDPQFASFSYNGYTPSSVNKHSSSKPLISLPVYQKYINKVKKADMSSNLKDLHRKMHS